MLLITRNLLPAMILLAALPFAAYAETVRCLGRIEPLDGVIVLAGPSSLSGSSAVVAELKVEEGDWVEAGDVLAVLDDYRLRSAEVLRTQQLVADAKIRLKRLQSLSTTQATSQAKLDEADYELRALNAEQRVYEARQEMSLVRAPHRAQVLEIFTRPGEKVGPDGVMEIGETDRMTVVAEVYETDIRKVAVGQRARILSPALEAPITGTVSKVGLKVGRQDVLDIDPIARADARVVEATIMLDDADAVARMTNLQVDVEIDL